MFDAKIPLLICLLAPLAAQAEVYKWVDADGALHFADSPPTAPSGEVEQVEIQTHPLSTFEAPPVAPERRTAPPPPRAHLEILTTQHCGICWLAKNYMKSNNIAYTEYDVENSAEGRAKFLALKAKGVPVIVDGERVMMGFNAQGFEAFLQGTR